MKCAYRFTAQLDITAAGEKQGGCLVLRVPDRASLSRVAVLSEQAPQDQQKTTRLSKNWKSRRPTGGLESEPCATMLVVSRLRRLLVSRQVFFITCKLLRTRTQFPEQEPLTRASRTLSPGRGRGNFLTAP